MSDCATLWTAACQAPLSMGFSRQEYMPFSRGSSRPMDRTAMQADSLPLNCQGSPVIGLRFTQLEFDICLVFFSDNCGSFNLEKNKTDTQSLSNVTCLQNLVLFLWWVLCWLGIHCWFMYSTPGPHPASDVCSPLQPPYNYVKSGMCGWLQSQG